MGAAAAAAVAWGLAVGEIGLGVAVAEDPQANNRATNKRMIALGQCLNNCDLDVDFGTVPSPVLRFTNKDVAHAKNRRFCKDKPRRLTLMFICHRG